MLLHTHQTFFYKFHMVCTSQPPKISWQTTVQTWRIPFDLSPSWMPSKEIVLSDWNHFCYEPILNNAWFTFMKKHNKNHYFIKNPYLLNDTLYRERTYIYIYIYIYIYNQQERIKLWKQHFENLLGNPPKITHEPITRIISKQLDIKLGPFTQEELESVLRKIKNRKAAGLDEIPPEVWKTRQFDDILLRHCNAVYNQNPIDRWMKGCILPFLKKGDLRLAKNYRGITLTSIAAKIYNALLRNCIEPKIDNILRKNQRNFRRNRSTGRN